MNDKEILIINGFEENFKPVIATKIREFEKQVKEIQAKEDELREKLLIAMRENGITKIDSEGLSITYIAPTKKETFDTKRIREERPDLYLEYVKVSNVKDSIKIRLK